MSIDGKLISSVRNHGVVLFVLNNMLQKPLGEVLALETLHTKPAPLRINSLLTFSQASWTLFNT